MLCVAITANAQPKIPTNAAEDVDKIMEQAYWDVWNPEVQKKIDADIEANRKADACFYIGKIAKDSNAIVEQISHSFIFGAHIFNFDQLGDDSINAKYKSVFGSLFNSATVAFYWQKLEMEPNRPRFFSEYWDEADYWNKSESPKREEHWRRPPPEPIIKFCKENNIRVHGHPLVWDNRYWHMPIWLFDYCLTDPTEREKMKEYIKKPAYIKNNKGVKEEYTDKFKNITAKELSKEFPIFAANLKKAFDERIKTIAKLYGDKVESWDVVNESAGAFGRGDFKKAGTLMKTPFGIMPGDFAYESFMSSQKYLPKNALLNINDYSWKPAYRDQIKDLLSRDCKIDIVGSQMHLFDPKASLAVSKGKIPDRINPDDVWKTMKMLDVGKPIHLSEVTITAADTTERGRMIQAIIARNIYRLWFSIKPMMGITWWNVVDDCGAPEEPSLSGLFTRGMEPKPAYFALNNLINNEWKTKEFSAKPDSDGNLKFRGFRGKYRVSWFDENGKERFKIFELK